MLPATRKTRLLPNPYILSSRLTSGSYPHISSNSVLGTFVPCDTFSNIIINSHATATGPNLDITPLTDSLRRPRHHVLLRHLYRAFAVDLFQGKRITLSAIEKEFAAYARTTEVLTAIDCSALLRWVPKTDESWIDCCEKQEEQQQRQQQQKEEVEKKSITSPQPPDIPITLRKTEVYRFYLGRTHSIICRPEIPATVARTSSEATMRMRKNYLLERAKTHDLILLGTPTHVLSRFSKHENVMNYAVKISRCAFWESFSHYLDYIEYSKRQVALLLKKQQEYVSKLEADRRLREQQKLRLEQRSLKNELLKEASTTSENDNDNSDENLRFHDDNKNKNNYIRAATMMAKVNNDDENNYNISSQRTKSGDDDTSSSSTTATAKEKILTLKQRIILQKQKEALEEQRYHEFFPSFTRTLQQKVPCFSTLYWLADVRNKESHVSVATHKIESRLGHFARRQNTGDRNFVFAKAVLHDTCAHRLPFPTTPFTGTILIRKNPLDSIDFNKLFSETIEAAERQHERTIKFFLRHRRGSSQSSSSSSSPRFKTMKPTHTLGFCYRYDDIVKEEAGELLLHLQQRQQKKRNQDKNNNNDRYFFDSYQALDQFFCDFYTSDLYLNRSSYGPVSSLVLCKTCKFGTFSKNNQTTTSNSQHHHQSSFSITVAESRSENECRTLASELDDKIKQQQQHQNATSIQNQNQNQNQNQQQQLPALLAWVGNDLILQNMYTSIERASRVASPLTNLHVPHLAKKAIWSRKVVITQSSSPSPSQQQQQQQQRLAPYSFHSDDPKVSVATKMLIHVSSSGMKEKNQNKNYNENFILINHDENVAVIRNIKYLSQITGWTSEFGADCGEILLKRFLLGYAREVQNICDFTLNVSDASLDTTEERYAAVFFVRPVVVDGFKKCWAVAIPSNSTTSSTFTLEKFRQELLSSSSSAVQTESSTQQGNEDEEDGNSDDGDDDDDTEEFENVFLRRNNSVRHLILELEDDLYVMIVRDSKVALDQYRKSKKQEEEETMIASEEGKTIYSIGATMNV